MPRSTQLWKFKDAEGDPCAVQIWADDQAAFGRLCHERGIIVTDIIERPVNDASNFVELIDGILSPAELED